MILFIFIFSKKMGNCGTKPRPEYVNQCGPYEEKFIVKYSCVSENVNDTDRLCRQMSDEWEFSSYYKRPGFGQGCMQSSCEGGFEFGFGCCNGCCGIIGGEIIECKRKYFSGDPFYCCFQDKECKTEDYCWTDIERKLTCAPEYRNVTTQACKDRIYDYCVGATNDNTSEKERSLDDNYDFIDFKKRWAGAAIPDAFLNATYPSTQPCYTAFWRNLYAGLGAEGCLSTPGAGLPSAQGFKYGRKMMEAVIGKYIAGGGSLIAGTPGYDPGFASNIWEICSNHPGLCQVPISNMCTKYTSNLLTRSGGTNALSWCGCYLSDDEYKNDYSIDKECTPLCAAPGVLKLPSNDGVLTKSCSQNICLIDNINLQLYGSQVGQIGFTQICPACQGGSCRCTISNSTLTIIDSDIPMLNLSQNCGTAVCYQDIITDAGVRTQVEVPCNADRSYDIYKHIEEERERLLKNAQRNYFITVILIIITAVVIVLLIFIVFGPRIKR
jgi:hypothetical protein